MMTKKQKAIQTKAHIEEILNEMRQDLLSNVDKALNSGALGDFFMDDDARLAKGIMDCYMRDRPYAPLNYRTECKKEFDNLHKFL